mgnify:CR=1 FL=1
MSSSLKKLASQTAIYGLSSILGRFLNYLLTPLWTNEAIFSKEQFGVITEMYAYVAFLVVLLTYGMETTFFRFANKPENNSTTVFSTALLSVSFTTAVFIGISIFYQNNIADWLMYPEHTEYVVWFAFIVGLDAISSIPLAQLRLLNKAKEFNSQIISSFINKEYFDIFFNEDIEYNKYIEIIIHIKNINTITINIPPNGDYQFFSVRANSAENILGMPVIYIYIFSVWLFSVLMSWIVVRRYYE